MHCLWECKLVQPLWKTAWRFLKKLAILCTWLTEWVERATQFQGYEDVEITLKNTPKLKNSNIGIILKFGFSLC